MKQSKVLKYTVIGARIMLGLIFFVFGFGYFFMKNMNVDLKTPMGQFFSAMLATGYFLPFLKTVEGISGFMLFFKRTTPLALLILAPIMIQILLFHAFLEPSGIPLALVNIALAVFLAWANWDKYENIFKA